MNDLLKVLDALEDACHHMSAMGAPVTKQRHAQCIVRTMLEQKPIAITTQANIAAMRDGYNRYITGRAPSFVIAHETDVPLYRDPFPAPNKEPVLEVELEPDYWHRGHFFEGTRPWIDPLKVQSLPIGTKLYTK